MITPFFYLIIYKLLYSFDRLSIEKVNLEIFMNATHLTAKQLAHTAVMFIAWRARQFVCCGCKI